MSCHERNKAVVGEGKSFFSCRLMGTYRFASRRYRLPFRAPVRTAHGLWGEREGVIVRLEGEGGVGWGEVAPVQGFGVETVDEVEAACGGMGEAWDSAGWADLPPNLVCLRSALAEAAAEVERGDPTALVPPGGRRPPGDGTLGPSLRRPEVGGHPEPATPLSAVGSPRSTLSVAALLPAGRAALAQVGPKAEAGFRIFKWKVAVESVADEFVLLDDLCAALPAGAKLRLDANGGWDRRSAERWFDRCADYPVEFVEQPIGAGARGAEDILRGLSADYPTPVALDESISGCADVARWLDGGWTGVFVVKPSLLGDAGAALARLEKAKAAVVFSSALETAVGARSGLGRAFAWPGEPRALGFGVWPSVLPTRGSTGRRLRLSSAGRT